jgi:hypothetical protein
MGRLLDLLSKPPPLPPIELPRPARLVPGVRTTIVKAFVVYYRGVYDGLVAGAAGAAEVCRGGVGGDMRGGRDARVGLGLVEHSVDEGRGAEGEQEVGLGLRGGPDGVEARVLELDEPLAGLHQARDVG